MSKRAAVNTVPDGAGKDQVRPLTDGWAGGPFDPTSDSYWERLQEVTRDRQSRLDDNIEVMRQERL
jgi:hypothetical protein